MQRLYEARSRRMGGRQSLFGRFAAYGARSRTAADSEGDRYLHGRNCLDTAAAGAGHYRVCDSRIAKVDCKWSLFQRWGQVRDIQPESLDNRKNKIRPAVKTSVDLRARSVAHCSPEPQ